MKYNVFISYRRNGGEYTARMICDRLSDLGYDVFFDVEALRSGDFNTKLYSVIDECDDVILILSPGALDRCASEEDWVRREIEYAIEKGKNIIPIMLRGFEFPEILPHTIEAIRFKNGIQANSEFFDAFIEKLQSFLSSKQSFWQSVKKNKIFKALVSFLLTAAVLLCGAGIVKLLNDKGYPSSDAEKSITDELMYHIQMKISQFDIIGQNTEKALAVAKLYVTTGDGYDRTKMEIDSCRKAIEEVDETLYVPDENFYKRLSKSPYDTGDAKALFDTSVSILKTDCLGNIDFIKDLIKDTNVLEKNDILRTIESYERTLKEQLKIDAYGVNYLLIPITNEEALYELKTEVLPRLVSFPLNMDEWSNDKDILEGRIEKSFSIIDNEMADYQETVDYNLLRLEQEKQKLIDLYIEIGYSEEEAQKLVEDIIRAE